MSLFKGMPKILKAFFGTTGRIWDMALRLVSTLRKALCNTRAYVWRSINTASPESSCQIDVMPYTNHQRSSQNTTNTDDISQSNRFIPFHWVFAICKRTCPGFEVVSPCPCPTTIIITPPHFYTNSFCEDTSILSHVKFKPRNKVNFDFSEPYLVSWTTSCFWGEKLNLKWRP